MTGISADDDTFCCPTCGARQPASTAECRRCRCDMTLVLAIRENIRRLHRNCLMSLASGDPTEALNCARRRFELCPDDISHRLLAVALLCLDRFDEAVQVHVPSAYMSR